MIQIFPDYEVLSLAAAELFVKQAQQALAKGRFSVALAGGNTPRRTYELLARSPLLDQIPWKIVHFFWSDERWVSPQDPNSNEGMAWETLLNHVPVPLDQIHRIYQPSTTIQDVADRYDSFLRKFFAHEKQLFDLVFLGLGENGHTASLFPHTPVLQERERWVAPVYLPEQGIDRVTLTAEALNQSAVIAFLVSGSGKADILHNVLEGPAQPEQWPAQLIQPTSGDVLWLVDEAAAHQLVEPNRLQSETVRR